MVDAARHMRDSFWVYFKRKRISEYYEIGYGKKREEQDIGKVLSSKHQQGIISTGQPKQNQAVYRQGSDTSGNPIVVNINPFDSTHTLS